MCSSSHMLCYGCVQLCAIHTCFFYKYIRIQGLGSDMLKATQNIDWNYAYDMLILCVKIFKMGTKSVALSHIAYIAIHKL